MNLPYVAVDTNILVYAHNRTANWHAGAVECLNRLAGSGLPWAIPWPCIHEFLAVVTNPRLVQDRGNLDQAIAQMDEWQRAPTLQCIGELNLHWTDLKQLLSRGRIQGGAVHDARIATICLEHGVSELWTADRDFQRFPGLRVRNPLVELAQ